LEHLKGLTALRSLDVSGTEVTDAGVQQLKQSLPNLTVVRREGPSRTQSADQPVQSPSKAPADREKPEQPPFAARTFNSKLALYVFVHETSQSPKKLVGRTPSASPLEIPPCWIWWVWPSTPVENWDLLVREISQNKVPK